MNEAENEPENIVENKVTNEVIEETAGGAEEETDDETLQYLPVTDALDLHTIPPRDIREVVVEYLFAAAAKGFREVRIIHGKGIGVQKRIVSSELDRHEAVESYSTASGDRGHWGATIVRLVTDNTR